MRTNINNGVQFYRPTKDHCVMCSRIATVKAVDLDHVVYILCAPCFSRTMKMIFMLAPCEVCMHSEYKASPWVCECCKADLDNCLNMLMLVHQVRRIVEHDSA